MTDKNNRGFVFDPDEQEVLPHRMETEDEFTETIDLASLLKADLSASGSFDIRGGIWASTFGKLLQALPIPALLVDQSRNIFVANQACGKIGAEIESIMGAPFCDLFRDHSAHEQAQSLLEKLFSNRKSLVREAALRIGNRDVWGRLTLRSIRISKDRFALVLVEDLTAEKTQYALIEKQTKELSKARDTLEKIVQERTADLKKMNERLLLEIAERKRHQTSLHLSRENFNSIVERSADGILVVDPAGMVIYANSSAEVLFGRPKGSLGGSKFGVPLASGGITNIDIIRPDGEAGVAQMRVERTDWDGEPSHLCVLRDITELKRLETDLLGRAYYDAATGLLNRKKFLNMLQATVRTSERYSLDLSVCICDLDQFKEVNDNYGHQAGDHVLAVFAEILKKELRESDFAGRYGGDEFIIALPLVVATSAKNCVDRIRNSLERKVFDHPLSSCKVTLSAGIAQFIPGEMSLEQLIKNADDALYKAKNLGRNRVVVDETGEVA